MRMKTERFGTGDQTWLASAHGMRNAGTAVIDISTFVKNTHYPDGFIKSGTPVNIADPKAVVPYVDGATAVLGFVLFDQPTDGATDFPAPIQRHGQVNLDRVPVTLAKPATGDARGFVFTTKGA